MTKVILLAWVAVFLLEIFTGGGIDMLLAFHPVIFPNAITGLVTYPLIVGYANIFGLLITGLVFYWFGGSLERSWGPRRFLIFLLLANVAAALVWEIGIFLFTGGPGGVGGPWFMLSSVIVAWAWLNPEATIMLWFILPMKAKWIGWLDIALLYVLMPLGYVSGLMILLMGFFALGGAAVGYAYARWERRWGWVPRQPREARATPVLRPSSPPIPIRRRVTLLDRLFAPVREWKRRRNIERLRKTWKLDD